ncbi:piggyBac transposable element-derived protein 4-like [Schistocerca americana]|uniref:piggyBac transposable element-derived protein 4-like n=1 Tax=Schistocerca americana TaxID=7009 RepID=UPI001F501A52|nr:piggyBac transposable element-derived protein 4-like [Schistocerca americana]
MYTFICTIFRYLYTIYFGGILFVPPSFSILFCLRILYLDSGCCLKMKMSRRGLRDEEIERLLCEIPSDEDSTVDTTDDESDYEASIVAEAIVSSEGEVSESEEESESTPPKRAADTAPTWGQQFNATSGMQFDSESGPSAFIRDIDDPEPIDIFEKIFPKELVELIVFQTNLYATQSGKSFTPTTDNEIRTFLGINILMGIKRMPAYRDYWSSAPELHDRYIASLMAVNRFGWLLRNIHLNDNTLHPEKGHPGYDKLYKLRPVIKILSESFSKCYQPSKHLAIDESMIKFKGRNSMKQYMRDKPIKRGYKVWMLCDKTSYNLKFDIYTGKVGDTVQTGLGEHVVLSLSSELVNKGHYLYFDNYFNSYNLLAGLQQRNIYACGTVQPTRKHLPKLKTDKELSRGEFDWRVSNCGILYLKWKDKRAVHLLSNFHSPEVTTVTRRERDGSRIELPCPQAVMDYNAHMNNVDKFDQLKKSYEISRRSKKWWHRIFFHLLDVSIVNSYIIWKELGDREKMTAKVFRMSILQSLVTQKTPLRPSRLHESQVHVKKNKPYVSSRQRLDNSSHQPEPKQKGAFKIFTKRNKKHILFVRVEFKGELQAQTKISQKL